MRESCSRRTASSCGVSCSFELFLRSRDIASRPRSVGDRLRKDCDSVDTEDYNFKLMEARGFRVDSCVHNETPAVWTDKLESTGSGGNGNDHPKSLIRFLFPIRIASAEQRCKDKKERPREVLYLRRWRES
jgi:hypothetical protein